MNSTGEIIEDLTNTGALAPLSTSVVAPFQVPEMVAVITTSEAYPALQAEVITALTQVRALPSYPALRQEMTTALETAKALKVTDADTYARAGALAGTLGALSLRAEAWWKPATDIAYKLHRWLTARRGVDVAPLEQERKRLLDEAGAWNKEQLRLEAERNAAAAAEAKRQADELAQAQALQLEAEGMPELAAAVIEEAAAAPAPLLQLASLVPKGVGMTHGQDWKIEIINAALVPREYCMPDENWILTVVRRMKGLIKIAGVKITPKDTNKGRRRAS